MTRIVSISIKLSKKIRKTVTQIKSTYLLYHHQTNHFMYEPQKNKKKQKTPKHVPINKLKLLKYLKTLEAVKFITHNHEIYCVLGYIFFSNFTHIHIYTIWGEIKFKYIYHTPCRTKTKKIRVYVCRRYKDCLFPWTFHLFMRAKIKEKK